jgi:ABC-type transport system involved in multi-copper enzyme maturation permease subunit
VIARDADQKTAEFLLSRPVSRRRILLTRWAAASGLVVLPVYITSISAIWISPAVDEQLAWGDVLLSSTYMSLFLVMLVSFTTMISAMSSHQLRAGIILIGVMLLNFAFYLVQGFDDFSLFKTVDVWVFMQIQAGELPWIAAGSFAVSTIAMLVVAQGVFQRRDF